MPASHAFWRSLLTVFQIVALVTFSVAGVGHAHAGTVHVGHASVTAAGPLKTSAPEPVLDASGHAERGGDRATASPCGPTCCCHASLVRWESATVAVAWKSGRALSGIREVAFDSLPSETLPEPPRTFA